jgi:small subunit ribosomal protein S19
MKQKFFDKYILKKLLKAQKLKKEKGIANDQIAINIWSRQSTIMENCVGFNFNVHNGKGFKKITISNEMVGKKFGEFAPTRFFVTHKKNKKG